MFKWVAALSMDLGPILLPFVVPIVMPALQRETNENNPNTGKKQKHSTTPLLPPLKVRKLYTQLYLQPFLVLHKKTKNA